MRKEGRGEEREETRGEGRGEEERAVEGKRRLGARGESE